MAQLPPRAPSMAHNWSSSPFQMMMPPPLSSTASCTSTSTASQQTSLGWFDEFLDFSSARRRSHRRTSSDPIAFAEEGVGVAANQFERLDDEQLRCMFAEDVASAAAGAPHPDGGSRPSTPPSDQNSENEGGITIEAQEPKNNKEIEESSGCKGQHPMQMGTENGAAAEEDAIIINNKKKNDDEDVDPKRIKRILANRQSAQRSRVRKLHYISELERSVTTLQKEVSALSPRVAYLDHQRLILNVDNSALKQRIAALAQDKIFKDAHQEALRKEIERLRHKYEEQNTKKSKNKNTDQNDSRDQE